MTRPVLESGSADIKKKKQEVYKLGAQAGKIESKSPSGSADGPEAEPQEDGGPQGTPRL